MRRVILEIFARVRWPLLIAVALGSPALVGHLIGQDKPTTPPMTVTVEPAPASEVERLTKQLNEALDELAVTRAARGDCEATLAPLEANARRTDSQQRWAAQKAAMEKARDGKFECDPRTLVCTKTPEPPKAPKKKDEPIKK